MPDHDETEETEVTDEVERDLWRRPRLDPMEQIAVARRILERRAS